MVVNKKGAMMLCLSLRKELWLSLAIHHIRVSAPSAHYQTVEFACILKLLSVTRQRIQFNSSWRKVDVPDGIQCLEF